MQRAEDGAGPAELAELFVQARRLHLDEVIRPFVEQQPHGVILLDRFADSTAVHQCLEPHHNALEFDELLAMHAQRSDNEWPDLTFILTIPEDKYMRTLVRRMVARRDKTSTWDAGTVEDHIARQRLFCSLPALFAQHRMPRRFRIVDASVLASVVVRLMTAQLEEHMRESGSETRLLEHYRALRSEGRWAELDERWLLDNVGPEWAGRLSGERR